MTDAVDRSTPSPPIEQAAAPAKAASTALPGAEIDEQPPIESQIRRPGKVRQFLAAMTWTGSQRRALIALLIAVGLLLLWRAIANRSYISDPQPPVGSRAGELANRIDPNSATFEELLALPNLGEKRARALVAYRQDWQRRHPGQIGPFTSDYDLTLVKGIGPGTVDALSPYMTYPHRAGK